MWLADGWTDYKLLDAGRGEKLERWGRYVLRRPDPQAIWPISASPRDWDAADATYARSASGGGRWEYARELPVGWEIGYRDLRFRVKLMNFKHTGVFPEQSVNWDWITARLRSGPRAERPPQMRSGPARVLNLFAYTGAASVAAAAAGARVCHVDAARGVQALARENAALSGAPAQNTRYIVDDVSKFVARENRRGSKYDAVVMDPPAYGRGPEGELWKAENQLSDLISLCSRLLSDEPLFFLVNSYANGISPVAIENILKMAIGRRFGGATESAELGLPLASCGAALPCGCTARWERGHI